MADYNCKGDDTMMPDREAKKKALDIMIVMGGKPKDDSYDKDSYEDKEEGSHECKCSCCGMPCPKCSKENEDDSKDSEDDSEEESDEDSEDYK